MNNVVYSALRTPDGTLLESKHRHDFVSHEDANGKKYMLDGGLDYIRSSCNGDEVFIAVTLDYPHEIVREVVKWGTYGKNGDEPYRQVKLSEMSNAHIRAIIETQKGIYPQFKEAMMNELTYRDANSIVIED